MNKRVAICDYCPYHGALVKEFNKPLQTVPLGTGMAVIGAEDDLSIEMQKTGCKRLCKQEKKYFALPEQGDDWHTVCFDCVQLKIEDDLAPATIPYEMLAGRMKIQQLPKAEFGTIRGVGVCSSAGYQQVKYDVQQDGSVILPAVPPLPGA